MKTGIQLQPLAALLMWMPKSEGDLIRYAPAEPQLYVRQQNLLQKCQQAHLPVEYLGTMPVFDGHRVYPGRRHDWVMINAAHDPLFRDRDGFPVPKRILKDLRTLQKSGVEFDATYVAHQVPCGIVSEGKRLEAEILMPPPSAAMLRLTGRLGTVGRVLWLLASLPVVACTAIGGLILAATTVGSAAGLDPILLGVAVAPNRPVIPGEPAAWFYLSHWAFDGEV